MAEFRLKDHLPPSQTKIDLVFEALARLAGTREAERAIRRSASSGRLHDEDSETQVSGRKVMRDY